MRRLTVYVIVLGLSSVSALGQEVFMNPLPGPGVDISNPSNPTLLPGDQIVVDILVDGTTTPLLGVYAFDLGLEIDSSGALGGALTCLDFTTDRDRPDHVLDNCLICIATCGPTIAAGGFDLGVFPDVNFIGYMAHITLEASLDASGDFVLGYIQNAAHTAIGVGGSPGSEQFDIVDNPANFTPLTITVLGFPVCGNGVVEEGELCDNGVTDPCGLCTAECTFGGGGSTCGDAALCPETEDCDDANTNEGDLCNSSCEFTSCGDGIVQNPNGNGENEACDSAGVTASCDSDCTIPECGDGDLNAPAGEQCDDGNTTSGDGCDQNCQVEPGSCQPPTAIGGIASRYIAIIPNSAQAVSSIPVTFRVECGNEVGWTAAPVTLAEDPGATVNVNVSVLVADCASASFLTPDQWTSSGANALYVTGLAVAPNSKPTVTAKCVDCSGAEAAAATPVFPTWEFGDSSGDGQTTFFADLFKQFSNTAAAGGPLFTGPDPGIEVDTQLNSPSVPDQQVTFLADLFKGGFLTTAAGGGETWSGEACP